MKPIYTTKVEHSQNAKPTEKKRRRIGQMSDRLQNELDKLSLNDRTMIRIAVGMAMLNITN